LKDKVVDQVFNASLPMNSIPTFEFATATRIVFGSGRLREVGVLAKDFGNRALVVTGSNLVRAEPLTELLRGQGVDVSTFPVAGEPHVDAIQRGAAFAKKERCEFVVSFGGGSVIDAGKAIAAMLTNEGDLLDHLEVIGRGRSITKPAAPFVAIPTTAGTGSEVTRNAVLASLEHRVKVSLRSPLMLARVALVDPELTLDLPPALTASTGLDALTQLIEPYVCSRANPMTDALCREGMTRAAQSLRTACENGRNLAGREDMALASLFGGMALANAGLGAVHGFAAPIGGMFPAPHGAVCAALLPHVMATNLRALRNRQPGSEALRRYENVAAWLTGNEKATADEGVECVRKLVSDLQIPPLRDYGLKRDDVSDVVEKATKASSMKANPIVLTREELAEILERAI
jgi:alcohol dehydrogenase class IV